MKEMLFIAGTIVVIPPVVFAIAVTIIMIIAQEYTMELYTVVDMKTGEFIFEDTKENIESYFALLARVGIKHPYEYFVGDTAFAEVA